MESQSISIWTTNGCNLKCKYCFYDVTPLWASKPEMMSDEVADKIIEMINSGSISSVNFFGGEPLFNYRTVQRIIAKSHPPNKLNKVGYQPFWDITTNGTLLTKEMLDFFELYDVYINLSFDGLKENQDYWRGNSYDKIMEILPDLLKYPRLGVLKTLANPKTLFEDVKHIKDLGFKGVFINLLDPFCSFTYDGIDIEDFKNQYTRVITELHGKDFSVGDYTRWKDLIDPHKPKGIGCGFSNRGLGIDWMGNFYPCHQGPSMDDKFRIGNVWQGLDEVKNKSIRAVTNSPSCTTCPYKLTKCYVSMYNRYGRFDVDPPESYSAVERAKIEVIEKLSGFKPSEKLCQSKIEPTLLIGTPINSEKYFLLKPWFENLYKLNLPAPTDLMFVTDDTDLRLNHIIDMILEGKSPWIKIPKDKFRKVFKIVQRTTPEMKFMDKITSARNIIVDTARKGNYVGLFFIDADILPEPDVVEKLLGVKADIVGALVKCRRDEKEGWYNNYIKNDIGYSREQKFTPNSIMKVDATGCDCVLVRRNVFKKQSYTYRPEIPEAEDMGYCRTAIDNGFSIVINTGARTKHVLLKDIIVKEGVD